MEIFVLKDGECRGPISPRQLKGYLSLGVISKEDFGYYQGLDDWAPIGSFTDLDGNIRCSGNLFKNFKRGKRAKNVVIKDRSFAALITVSILLFTIIFFNLFLEVYPI